MPYKFSVLEITLQDLILTILNTSDIAVSTQKWKKRYQME